MLYVAVTLLLAIATVIINFLKVEEDNRGREGISFKKNFGLGKTALGVVVWGAATVFASFNIVDTGTVLKVDSFGVIQPYVLTQGLAWSPPWTTTEEVDIKRYFVSVDSSGEDATVRSLTSDGTPLGMEVNFPFRINPMVVPQIYSRIGGPKIYGSMLQKASQSALREAVAGVTWKEAAITNRVTLSDSLSESWARILKDDLMKAGLSESDAETAFVLFPPIISEAVPPERITREIEEDQAAQQELNRQETLTKIAEEIASRRENEGEGIAKMFDKLPEGFTPEEIALIITANAAETQANALMKAVEAGQLNSIVFTQATPTTPVN